MLTIENFFSSLEGAYAPNTIRSYRSDYMHYSDWCQKYQYGPFNIHEEQFADYILQMGEILTVATIQRRVASLSSIFSLTKNTNPHKGACSNTYHQKTSKKIWKTSETGNAPNL